MSIESRYPYWATVFKGTFELKKPPYTGVNLMTVKKDNLQPLLENLRKQTRFVHDVGATMTALTMSEHDHNYSLLWCFHYPEEFSPEKAVLHEKYHEIYAVVSPEWFRLIESYDWYLIESDAANFPASSEEIYRQVMPPSDDKGVITETGV